MDFAQAYKVVMLTKTELLKYFKSEYAIATFLGLKPQAVYAWDETIPQLRAYQLKERRGEWPKKRK